MELLITIFIFFLLLTLGWATISLAPWVPTRKKDLERICQLANLQPSENFYDLGCGDGRLVFYSAKNYQTNSIGIELAFPFYLYCQIRQWLSQNKNIQFKFKNLYQENLSSADIVFFFAASSKKITDKLKTKLKKELKPNARIISYVFPIPNWPATKISKPTVADLPIYLYIMSS
ncbi:MAG: class I SAM-dependent methyltransferase [Candidatus Falkowbacteria bacterium]|nr:class I SAM-dependent methyltransferase [Candidatus Falkowbacteria bacterium]